MIMTDHGRIRVRKICGLNKKTADKAAQKALEHGLTHAETTGRLNKYYTYLYYQNKTANNIKIHADYVWIFAGDVLITVFPVPPEHIRAARKKLS